jgi:peptidylprolyl isomerase
VQLINWFPRAKLVADMSVGEKRTHGLRQREEGTALLRASRYGEASAVFEAGIESLGALHGLMLQGRPDPAKMAEVADALRSCLLNRAQCALKLEDWPACVEACTRVLAMPREAENVKALYRRGVARLELAEHAAALDDLREAATLAPKDREVRDGFTKAKAAHAAHKQAERQAFGGMFGGAA